MFIPTPFAVGPIRLGKDTPVVSTEGISLKSPARFEAPLADAPREGKWIWIDDQGQKPQPTRFRKAFDLNGAPGKVIALVSADVRYRLWINGALVSRGPSDVGRDYDSEAPGPWFDDVREVGAFLHPGHNVVAAEVFPTKLVSSEGTTGHPGFKLDLVSGRQNLLKTDASWRGQVAADLVGHEGKNGFTVDMSKEPVGWNQPTFDGSGWQPCVAVKPEEPATILSELPPPMEAIVEPIATERVSDGVHLSGKNGGAVIEKDGGYTLRYPRVMSAYVAVTVDGQRGASLKIMPNEADAPGFNRHAEILLRDGLQTVELPFFDSFTVINLQVEGATKPINIHEVRAVFTSYPVSYQGAFSCDQEDLNQLWKVCRWVTQICMQTHHLDSPHHQEPISDAGDYLIEALNNYYAFGDSALARQDLRKIARTLHQRNYQSFHTSYSLLWVRMLMEYWDYSGDADLVRELGPDVHRLLDQFKGYIGKNGLISEAPNYMFLDWVNIQGFNLHHPPAVLGQGYMTALYYQALGDDKRVSVLEGNAARAEADQKLAESIRQAFDRELWDGAKGLYRDGKPHQTTVAPNQWLPADADIEAHSTQVNALAVACGLAQGERATQVMERVMTQPDLNCQPYFMHFVFDALDKAGLFDKYAVAQMRRWHILPDSQSFYEMWDTGDRSHAWNATPLFQMSGRMLGVRPLEPGFKRFVIQPEPCLMKHAEGVVPTPFGDIRVSWKFVQQVMLVEFTVPPGTEAQVVERRFGPGHYKLSLQPH